MDLKVVFAFGVLSALTLGAVIWREAWTWYRLARYGLLAGAEVKASGRTVRGIYVQYQFQASAGRVFLGADRVPRSMQSAVLPSRSICIRYDPRNPCLSRIDHQGYRGWGFNLR